MSKRYSHKRGMRQVKLLFACWVVLVIGVMGCWIDTHQYQPPAIMVVHAQTIPKEINVVVDYTKGIGTIREVSAYTSRVEETDDTPCIAADGSDICVRASKGETLCAANFVPLGSKLTIDKFGTCTVADRMNRRYQNRVDVYMGNDLERARSFGLQKLEVATVKS